MFHICQFRPGTRVLLPRTGIDKCACPRLHTDCNNDGIVDYGQILAGDLSDANANNIPDCCEGSASCDPCPADIVHDGFVNAIDLAAVLNNWGSAGGKINADANDDGLVDAQDLAIVLSAWGACE